MRLKSLAALMLCTVATPAFAEDWVWIATSDDRGAALLIDADGISNGTGDIHGLRVLTVMRARVQSFDALVSEVKVNCGANTIRVGRTSAHDLTGKQLLVEEDKPEYGWDPVIPGSNYDSIARVVCGREPMPKKHYGAAMPVAQVREELVRKPGA